MGELSQADRAALLGAASNLSRFHRDHEKFYATRPREEALQLQRHARSLHALADRWEVVEPTGPSAASPYAGADDLNDPAALQLDGVLFMEGGARPVELDRLVRDLRGLAEDYTSTGAWLGEAMQASWSVAGELAAIDGLEDLLGDRHRIIANDWLAADMSALVGRILMRAADLLDQVELAPDAVRVDLASRRRVPAVLHSTAEMVNRAADLCSESAGLVNDNERRWRVFHGRVVEMLGVDDSSTRDHAPTLEDDG
ncbi:MAG TPA: hypothetical protein VIY72_13060 [Acidimicrobiales bacterium]